MATYTSKTDMVAATLRELIIAGELRPGSPLRQRDLAERFGVSQTPVREALQRLESEGLVRGDLHKGATVSEADKGATEENFQIRAALESLGAELAAPRIGEADLERLEELNAELAGIPDGDPRYADLNRHFHHLIYEAASSPLLLAIMRLLWQSMPQGPRVLRTHLESTRQHAQIIDALRARDGARAARITREHILGAEHLDNHAP
ncbi:GntR family transcriptional regulator [Nonomuraea polychroma]|uniref:GntR family transcriptional regulator n=1 Tax=Nonomuraea polychroma TaxID=46176 RepID=A0A438LZH1_9ACTN|nr:GntR family transcriptional regulator [Nonomuraea polychroma]RVX38801.1 GntR family transcriptional regulator [Nonomuraea polychroma]